MKRAVADKIASVAESCELSPELRLGADIPAEEGVVVAVEILNDKAAYNHVELASGRMALVQQGDVLVGALGHRKALFGYSGSIPRSVQPGDVLQLLNLGGVIGTCDSADPERGEPFDCRVLGAVLEFPYLGERIGVPARVGASASLEPSAININGIPIVAVAGTCMDSGKTAAACAIISHLRHKGLVVDAFKATGVSAKRDILAMEDAGARETRIFTDLGIVTTSATNASRATTTILNELARGRPDIIVFELGDGLLGAYGVETILDDDAIKSVLTSVVLSANDPVAAWGGVTLLRDRFGIEPTVVTGPATDNAVGIDIIRRQLALDAANARTSGALLGDIVFEHCHERAH